MAASGPRPVDTGGLVVAVSALFVVIGAFLGWFAVPISEPLESVGGTGSIDALGSIDGIALFESGSQVFNGIVTIGLASIVATLALLAPDFEIVNVLTAVGGLCIELIAVAFLVAPDIALQAVMEVPRDAALSSTGVGVYVTLVGGLGILLGGVVSYRRS